MTNVYVNMEEISRAMGCSAEQAYNQTMFLLQPFDAMMVQLNWTIGGLQQAARNISRGLRPLADGLDLVEKDLYNGKLQLYGTRKVSRCTCLALYWLTSFSLTCLIYFNQVSIAMYCICCMQFSDVNCCCIVIVKVLLK